MTIEYESLEKLTDACRVLDACGIGWAAASCQADNPFGADTIVYRLYATDKVPSCPTT